MAQKMPVTDIILAVGSIVVAALCTILVQPYAGRYGMAISFLAALFLLLYLASSFRGWRVPFPLPVARSSILSEIFLGLFLLVVALALSWYLGLAISRAFTDEDGILIGLVIFGALMLGFSAYRDWQ